MINLPLCLVFFTALALFQVQTALTTVTANKIVYVKPSSSASKVSSQDGHLSLSEWIEKGGPFANYTTIKFLAGLHLINVTNDTLVVDWLVSINITGDPQLSNSTVITHQHAGS